MPPEEFDDDSYCPDCKVEHRCPVCHDSGIVVSVQAFEDLKPTAATSPCRDCPAGAPPQAPVANGAPPV